METFPTLEAFAAASLETVLKSWEGLGYYARVKNMLAAARSIVEHYGGVFPSTEEALLQIKGIGDYTQGAIRSFAFHQPAAAIDGNVARLLSRFLASEAAIDHPRVKRNLRIYVEKILPDEEPWLVTEGLIELGALVCGKVPQCGVCPLQRECRAYHLQSQDILPRKKARMQTTYLRRVVAVILSKERRILLGKGKEREVMADLHEFPFLPYTGEI
jgi:A/G-specific adenine glycosylase